MYLISPLSISFISILTSIDIDFEAEELDFFDYNFYFFSLISNLGFNDIICYIFIIVILIQPLFNINSLVNIDLFNTTLLNLHLIIKRIISLKVISINNFFYKLFELFIEYFLY